MVGPKLTYRGDNVNYFVHTLFGWERVGARTDGDFASEGVGALLGGGMDLKLWKRVYLRVFEADSSGRTKIFRRKCPLTKANSAVPTSTVPACRPAWCSILAELRKFQ